MWVVLYYWTLSTSLSLALVQQQAGGAIDIYPFLNAKIRNTHSSVSVWAFYFVWTSRQFRTNINIAKHTLRNRRITICRTVHNCTCEARNCTVTGLGNLRCGRGKFRNPTLVWSQRGANPGMGKHVKSNVEMCAFCQAEKSTFSYWSSIVLVSEMIFMCRMRCIIINKSLIERLTDCNRIKKQSWKFIIVNKCFS